jgi:hypothetical protein
MTDPKTEESEKPEGWTTRKLTAAQWNDAILEWKQGEATLVGLSKKYGVSKRRLQEKFKHVGAVKGEILARQAAAAEAALVIEPSELAKRIFTTKNETYKIIAMIRQKVAAQIIDAHKQGKPLGTLVNDIRALRDAATTVRTCREEAYKVLGIQEDDAGDKPLPELTIRGMTPEEISDLQEEAIDGADAIVSQLQREREADEAAEALNGNPS